ncbi:MAG: heparan-alpha-glucosaminide N-acetyltransferase domain-containing protein [Candidatus Izemoplasmatales bacterium]
MEREKGTRIWEVDFLRGFSIIMMVWDHLMYDLKSLPSWFSNFYAFERPGIEWLVGFASDYWHGDLRATFHYVFVGFFLVVSGISFTFSRSNLKRGLKFLLFAVLISAVTMTVDRFADLGISVFFGIIHMFALGTLITWALRKIWDNDMFMLAVGSAVVILGVLFAWRDVPAYGNVTWDNFLSIIVGTAAYGADHFGLLPYTGVIMIGTVIGNRFYAARRSLLPKLDGRWNRPFVLAGRHTLAIFVAHQPVIAGLIFLIGLLAGYRF